MMNQNKIEHTGANVSYFKSKGFIEIFVKEINELVAAVFSARESGNSLYPISTGCNWGLGSKLPTNPKSQVLNLSNMNKIISFDEEEAVVVIEPGVTQEQLAKFLKDNHDNFSLDVTGSSKDSSLVGNLLERGIAYNQVRVKSLVGLEVVCGTGKIIRTGSWRFENSRTKFSYMYGVGPELTGLFLQSNLGIVSKAAIKLTKKVPHTCLVQMNFKSLENVARSLTPLNELMGSSVVESIFHIANKNRAKGAMKNHIAQLFEEQQENPHQFADELMEKLFRSEWFSGGVIFGHSKEELKYKRKALIKKMSPYCKIRVFNIKTLNRAEKILSFFKKSRLFAELLATKAFRILYLGVPTDAALGSILSFTEYKNKNKLFRVVDKSKKGFLYCLPITKSCPESCLAMTSLIEEVTNKFGFSASVTLNPIMVNVLEAVVSIDFDPSESKKAQECIYELEKKLIKEGHAPYRTNIKNMELYFNKDSYYDTLLSLKKALDPDNIISPGRYLPEY